MKNLTLTAHVDIKQALADALRSLAQVSEFTFTHIESHSVQDEYDRTLSARDRVVGYTPHIRVDIPLQDADVDAVLHSLRSANCGLAGRGSYQVTDVREQGAL